MMSVEEAFEKLADDLTPTAEQFAEVDGLHELLRQQFASTSEGLASIELLSVIVVRGRPWPMFAFVLRDEGLSLSMSRIATIESRLRKTGKRGYQVDGSPLFFDASVGVLGPRPPSSPDGFASPREIIVLGEALPSLMESEIGSASARLARLVVWRWGSQPAVYELGPLARAIVANTTDHAGSMGEALRGVLASFPAREQQLLAVRADYALHLARTDRLIEAHAQWRKLFGAEWPVDPGPIERRDVISEVTVCGLRSIDAARLSLRGLTVLIGENGSGKSTLIEACELMRRMASPAFLDEINSIHGGLRLLQRHGAKETVLRVEVSGADLPLQYEVRLAAEGTGVAITSEELVIGRSEKGAPSVPVITRDRRKARVPSHSPEALSVSDGLTLTSFGSNPPDPAFTRMIGALKAIEVHVPFEVTPAWVGRAHGRQSVLRGVSMIQAATSLERLGVNLANAFHALRSDGSEAHWRETMDYVRLGLGDRIESVNTRADVAGGAIALWVKLRGRDEQIPAASLSEGTLAYLAFVALFRLPSKRSLLVFDEPELHLHPRLLTRVMGFFHSIAERVPVVLATHSRRLLDELQDPAGSAVLCELDEADTTRLRYPDRAALGEWLVDYEGLGRVLDAGYESEVMVRREEA